MQLKKESFGSDESRVELYELSALQRVDYLAHLVAQESLVSPSGASHLARVEHQTRQIVTTNAWLVSQSLWQANPAADVAEVMRQVLQSWPPAALSAAALQVLTLSGMLPAETDARVAPADSGEPVSPEKP